MADEEKEIEKKKKKKKRAVHALTHKYGRSAL